EGAISVGVDPDLAMKIFDLVEKFAGYGFNKSHSAAYAVVSYQTLWLKCHYPAPFMAAVLTSDMQNTDKVVGFVEECREMKLDLVLPNVNQSEFGFIVNDEGSIVYGLGAVKGAGEGPVAAIVEARNEGGAFKDLFDFCKRCDPKRTNKRVLEALVRSGGFDCFGEDRAVLMASIEDAVKAAQQSAANEASGVFDLFGDAEAEAAEDVQFDVYEKHRHLRGWTLKERLQGEKDTLGLFVTGHPFDEYEDEVRQLAPTKLSNLRDDKKVQKLAGLIVNLRIMKNKRGENMCFITLDDRTGRVEVSLFSEAFEKVREVIDKDKVIIIEANVRHDDYSGGLKANAINAMEISQARLNYAKSLKVKVRRDQLDHKFVANFKQMLEPVNIAQGEHGCPVILEYSNDSAQADIQLGDRWRIRPTDEQLLVLKYAFGEESVAMDYS
ncbi:OB-fold nucleic acid binding domain-containing protein, partial [uncultured Paraglaciecola sp.]|uniref:helix-hairpin-helix domain-containing protein n=1 Tax=uncultured Paraglaciecola sp. TaxID=1765024 RepID=UPI00261B2A16